MHIRHVNTQTVDDLYKASRADRTAYFIIKEIFGRILLKIVVFAYSYLV